MVQARYPGLAAGIETTASWTLLKARRHRAWRHATPLRGNPGRVGRRSAGVEAQQDHRRDLAESRARDPVRPFPFDLHKDHGETFHALSVAWRTSSPTGCKIKSVYCYEVQSETHWNAPYLEAGFLPNTWVDITAHLETKLRALACYESRLRPMPDARSLAVIRALAVWRGSQQSFAATEAFVCCVS